MIHKKGYTFMEKSLLTNLKTKLVITITNFGFILGKKMINLIFWTFLLLNIPTSIVVTKDNKYKNR